MMLHAHDWDDDAHRLAIHTAFDIWFACFMSVPQNRRQTTHWFKVLRALTERAAERRVLHVEQARIAAEFRCAIEDGDLAEAV